LPKTTPRQEGQWLVQKTNKLFVLLFEIECISPGGNVNQFFLVKILRLPAGNQTVMTIISAYDHIY
jgi:hypothetical protein